MYAITQQGEIYEHNKLQNHKNIQWVYETESYRMAYKLCNYEKPNDSYFNIIKKGYQDFNIDLKYLNESVKHYKNEKI